ncbi:AAA family ATPase [Reichenbachiella sp. MALMAid0571]|uniref:nSTAND3 domain-containing NTPase n=1 Tax=Reichenbachiella sp. MALMAid0571 TaxID=3143939 RepID=UPI0032DFB951
MSKLQHISDRLLQVNGDIFQELCDMFLILRNQNYKAYSRRGSVPNKQKTRKGTPDSFLLLANGDYLFMEATTFDKGLFEKLLGDIHKCFDENKTGIKKSKIREVVLCFNSDLSTKETEQLLKAINCYNDYTSVSIYGLSRLSSEIYLHHRNLASEYLGLPLDTGQIISLDQFVKNYNNSSQRIATPLDNEFKHRKGELESTKSLLNNHHLLILSGPPGVGKTRLALECIKEFLSDNDDFKSYAIVNKDADILADLNQYVSDSSHTVLFIDDVNRYDRFSQVLGFLQYFPSKLKVLLTVRDYALSEVSNVLMSFNFNVFHLQKFKDEEIKEIIESDPFKITNSRYHNKIFEIANGNPRLAIMVALLAIKEQKIDALYDVSDLFDHYFGSFIHDEDAFSEKCVLQVLGIISFFYSIPYTDSVLLNRITKIFAISKTDFVQSIDRLEKLELVELKFEHVKIAEQNVSTFFFYKVFIKDQLLSFESLLENYFDGITSKFRDTVIPANNTFGYENVMEKLKVSLKSFWFKVRLQGVDKVFHYLDHFWFYLQDEALSYVFDQIESLPAVNSKVLVVKYETNDFSYDQNNYIKLLGEFMGISGNKLLDVLELSFGYVRKNPQHLPELIKKIDEMFSIDYDDEDYGLPRHKVLMDFFEKGISSQDRLISLSFIAVSKKLLQYQFQQYKSARGNAISIYRYPLQFYKPTEQIRKRIWQALASLFSGFHEECFEVLMSHQREHLDFNKEIFNYDLQYIISIVEKNLSLESFKHCQYVHELISWSKKNEIIPPEFVEWKRQFSSKKFEWLKKSDWNHFLGKEKYEFDDWNEFRILKEQDIRNSLKFNSVKGFKEFIGFLVDGRDWDAFHNKEGFWDTLDIVLDETFNTNQKLGFQFLKEIILNERVSRFYPSRTIKDLSKSKVLREKFWNSLHNDKAPDLWKIEYLGSMSEENIDEKQLSRLYQTYDDLSEGYYISFKPFEKYLKRDPNLYENLLRKVLYKAEEENLNFTLGFDFFQEVTASIVDTSLLKKAYLYQQSKGHRTSSHYDHDGSGLKVLTERDSDFFIEYIYDIFKDGQHHSFREHRELTVVWVLPDYSKILDQVLNIVIEKKSYHHIGGHFMNVFFKNLRDNRGKAEQYLLRFIDAHYRNPKKVSIIIDVVVNSVNNLFEEVLTKYLQTNSDIKSFVEINWLPEQSVVMGDVNWGDRRATQWTRIKNIVEKMDSGYKLIPIKEYINERIDTAKQSGDLERKRKFITPNW